MDFDCEFVNEHYELRYTASEAGEFGLHLWTESDGAGKRSWLPGSPFSLRVTGVRASPAGSFISGLEEYFHGGRGRSPSISGSDSRAPAADLAADKAANPVEDRRGSLPNPVEDRRGALAQRRRSIRASRETDERASITAGERLLLSLCLHDEFGNASFATDGGLEGYIETPEGDKLELPMKQLRDLGRYEIAQELTKKGVHTLGVQLDGEHIGGSPVQVCMRDAPCAMRFVPCVMITDVGTGMHAARSLQPLCARLRQTSRVLQIPSRPAPERRWLFAPQPPSPPSHG